MRKFSYYILGLAERFYLYAHGWQKLGDDYVPPVDYPFKKHAHYGKVHAVNAQRQVYSDNHNHNQNK